MPRNRSLFLFALIALALAAPLAAATEVGPHSWCGTQPSLLEISLAKHHDFKARLAREGFDLEKTPAQLASQAGNVAVLVNDGTLVHAPNPFDLADSGLLFSRKKTGMQVVRTAGAFNGNLGSKLALTDDSTTLVSFPRGFRFLFFGKAYTKVYVNSDGNLTFGAADFQSTERSVARFLNGPPRVAPFFADLDPGAAPAEGGVYYLAGKTSVTFTWQSVPMFGETAGNTFQVTLYKDGRIAFTYLGFDGEEAVAGVAPGGGGQIRMVDYTADLPTAVGKSALAERFGTDDDLDEVAIANAFFREFADVYDTLIVWLDFNLRLGGGAFAYEFTPKNDVRGIGVPVYDYSREMGSIGRLRSFVEMGTLARYPSDLNEDFLRTDSTLDVLGEEAGHRWLAFLHFRDGGTRSTALLGRDLAHWAFTVDTDASNMEGNEIQDNGDGSFTTTDATERFSPLDQYAMGLIPPGAVPPFFYVADSGMDPTAPPSIGASFTGRKVEVTIQDVIAAEGARVPASTVAPKTFNMAFIVVSRDENPPSNAAIEKVDTIRRAWEEYFATATDGHGAVDTTLHPR